MLRKIGLLDIGAALFLLPFLITSAWADPLSRNITVAPDVDVPVSIYPAKGKPSAVLLWLPSEVGVANAEKSAAEKLAEKGIEVWVADTLFARFLPLLPSSMEKIPPSDIARLIEAARRSSSRPVYLISAGRGAVPALEGAALWQKQHGKSHEMKQLAGAILFFPNLYVATPDVGEDADYLPIASHTHLDIMILQGNMSPWYWRLDRTREKLEKGGSKVSIQVLLGARDRFYAREHTSIPLKSEQEMAGRMPDLVYDALKVLQERESRP
jgi:hypothetical protein